MENKEYSPSLDVFECIPTFCDNPIAPNETLNYNLTWDGNLVAIDDVIAYDCKHHMRFEQNVGSKHQAPKLINITCGSDAEFQYPENWTQCSQDVNCGPPPLTPVNVSRNWIWGRSSPADNYDTHVRYTCVAGSRFDTDGNGLGETKHLYNRCNWNRRWRYPQITSKCVISHCISPFPIPDDTSLITSSGHTPINTNRVYECEGWNATGQGTHTKFFETDRSITSFTMPCKPDGYFNFVNKRENWPTCLSTVHCGQPPNATENGYRDWVNRQEFDDTYDTIVRYRCINGSEFDVNGNGVDTAFSLDLKCLWDKTWSPAELPPCVITHCVDPFDIPENTSLEASTQEWTKIRQDKEYRCKDMQGTTHTRFFEYDRTRSSFGMRCLDNGTFMFDNSTEHWPICLEGNRLQLF